MVVGPRASSRTVTFRRVLSDAWLEANAEDVKRALSEPVANFDLSETRWIELSALMMLCGLIVISSVRAVNFNLPRPNGPADTTGSREALRFLIESEFFLAIKHGLQRRSMIAPIATGEEQSSPENMSGCFLWFFVDGSPSRAQDIVDSMNLQLSNKRDGQAANTPLAALRIGTEHRCFVRVDVSAFSPGISFEPVLFAGLQYVPSDTHDVFIIPLRYFTKEDAFSYIEGTGDRLPTLETDLDAKHTLLHSYAKDLLPDLRQLYLYELVQNAAEHGGRDVILCVRLGEWLVRDRHPDSTLIERESYAYRSAFFHKTTKNQLERYVDVLVLDTGIGFDSLREAYEAAEGPLKGKHVLKKLHRYALYPHTTSKKNRKNTSSGLFTTGLGLLAEQVSTSDGVIAIKDRSALTYFTKDNLSRPTNEGDHDPQAQAEFPITLTSVVLPTRDHLWRQKYHIRRVSCERGAVSCVAFAETTSARDGFIPTDCWEINSADRQHHDITGRISIAEVLEARGRIAVMIIDLSDTRPHFTKSDAQYLIEQIATWRQQGLPVVLVSAQTMHMKLLQVLCEHGSSLVSFVLCPILSTDLQLFWCGRLDEATRAWLDEDPLRVPLEHGWPLDHLPLRTIERALNRVRGQCFLREIEAKACVQGPVLDSHDNLLAQYYDIKTYLGEHDARSRWRWDIARIIARHAPDLVVVDSPELRLIVNDVIALHFPDLKVARLHEGAIEGPSSTSGISDAAERVLAILAAAHTGHGLARLARLRERGVRLVGVVTLLDLTGRPSADIERELGCSYDRFAKTAPPKRMEKPQEPRYVSNRDARLVPLHEFDLAKSEVQWRAALPQQSSIALMRATRSLSVGHIIEHGHHYDVFLDVRRSIFRNDRLGQVFRLQLHSLVAQGIDVVLSLEQSEVAGALAALRLTPGHGPGHRSLKFYSAREAPDGRFIWQRTGEVDLQGRRCLIVDEGIYSGRSLIELLDLVYASMPSKVVVAVLERRRCIPSRIRELERLSAHLTPRPEYHCIVNINAPSWLDTYCPYCAIGEPLVGREPQSMSRPASLHSLEITTEAEYMIWFLGGLYDGRKTALERLSAIDQLGDDNRDWLILAARCLLIHAEVVSSLSLVQQAAHLVERAMFLGKTTEQCMLIKLAGRTAASSRWDYLKIALDVAIGNLSRSPIFHEVIEAVSRNKDKLPIIKDFCRTSHLDAVSAERWRYVLESIEHGEVGHAIATFYALTKVHRSLRHERLSARILGGKVLEQEIVLLRHVLDRLTPSTASNELRDLVHAGKTQEMAKLLEDPSFVARFSNEYCIRLDELMKRIGSAVGTAFESSQVYSERTDGRDEIALICLPPHQLREVIDHLATNKRHGICDLETTYDQHSRKTAITVLSKNTVTVDQLRRANSSASLASLRVLVSSIGVDIAYTRDAETGRFITTLTMGTVDNVQVHSRDM